MTDNFSLDNYIERLRSSAPTPGGGSASCIVSLIATSLASMVSKITLDKIENANDTSRNTDKEQLQNILSLCDDIEGELANLSFEDEESYNQLSQVFKMPKDDANRKDLLEKGLERCANVPLKLMHKLNDISEAIDKLSNLCSANIISDIGVAISQVRAASDGALIITWTNTKYMKNRENAKRINDEAKFFNSQISEVYAKVLNKTVGEIQN